MTDRYFFDKRDWKRRFTKYGIIFLISFVPVVLFNVYCGDMLGKRWLVIFLDCVLLLVFICIGNAIANKIFEKKDAKLERLRKEREALDAQKKQIMEDSYKRKHAEKEKQKAENLKAKESDVIVDGKEEPKKETKTSKKTASRRK